MTLRTLNYGNYGIFVIMGNAGFCPSTVGLQGKSPLGHWAERHNAGKCQPRAQRLRRGQRVPSRAERGLGFMVLRDT